MQVTIVVIAILTAAASLSSAQTSISEESPVCNAVFDFYFVLDSSSSVVDHFHSQIVPFVANVTHHYVEPDFRIAIVTFSDQPVIHLKLTRTANRDEVQAGIKSLEQFQPEGATLLAPALKQVNDQIATLGGDSFSVVLVLTDGRIVDQSQASVEANVTRAMGGSVFAIGVGNIDREELSQIADNSHQVYTGNDFQYLNQVIDIVVNQTCVEIQSVVPAHVCAGSTQNVTLHGRGFTNKLQPGQAACRFQDSEGELYLSRPLGDISYNAMTCPLPGFNHTDNLHLQVTVNGISFISSVISMEINSCQPTQPADLTYVAALFFSLLVVILLIVLFLLWFFFPLITCKVVGGPPPQRKESKVKGTPGRKWEVVDASYYGGRGAGGITQMTVKWGSKGATEEGNKLEKAKDANVVTVKRQPGRPTPRSKPPSCWDATKQRVGRWYATISSYRPVYTVNGPARKILWSPRKITNKYTVQVNRNSVKERRSSESKV